MVSRESNMLHSFFIVNCIVPITAMILLYARVIFKLWCNQDEITKLSSNCQTQSSKKRNSYADKPDSCTRIMLDSQLRVVLLDFDFSCSGFSLRFNSLHYHSVVGSCQRSR